MYVPSIYTAGAVSGLLVLFLMGLDVNVSKRPEELMVEADFVEQLADEKLREKVERIEALKK